MPVGASFRCLMRVIDDDDGSILEELQDLDAGYMGAPFVRGQVNESDTAMFGLDFGYMGGPLVAWSNE